MNSINDDSDPIENIQENSLDSDPIEDFDKTDQISEDIISQNQNISNSSNEYIIQENNLFDPIINQKFLSSDYSDQIDTSKNDDFFKEEFITFKFLEEKTIELELWDCQLSRILFCEYISDVEKKNNLIEKNFYLIINSKSLPQNLLKNIYLAIYQPFHIFSFNSKFGILVPNLNILKN